MNRDFLHNIYSSFVLYFDHTLLQEGAAYNNVSGSLYSVTDSNISGKCLFGSPYKQWVYDSSVSGATIPSGVYVNGNFVSRGTTGLILDFQNGRSIFNSCSPSWNVSGRYSAKEFNIYTTTKSDYELLFETRYDVKPRFPQNVTGTAPDKLIAPCIFIKFKKFDNKELALGGELNSTVNFRAIIMSDDEYKLNGVANIFVDKFETYFRNFEDTGPLNRFGDIKGSGYNYVNSSCSGWSADNLGFIKEVSYSRYNGNSLAEHFPDLQLGFLDFRVEVARFR